MIEKYVILAPDNMFYSGDGYFTANCNGIALYDTEEEAKEVLQHLDTSYNTHVWKAQVTEIE